ncbi:hypothetical protein LJC08_01605 [Methanimicrococcus sp. OttesenSCG-928-J09]|nr:hypothetical protein [Methanimicrococcus sp. OttesenSCG-928-J09]
MSLIFPVAVQMISPATKLYVIVEKSVYEPTDDKNRKNTRNKIIESIEELKKIATPFVRDGVEIVKIENDSLDTIRENIFSIYKKDKDAKYYMNITNGTKALAIGLFLTTLWIEGAIPYHVDRDGDARIISIPKISINDFQKNPNRVTILNLLNSAPNKTLSRKDLQKKLSEKYIPAPDYESSKKTKRSISYGSFNLLIEYLKKNEFIEVKNVKDSKKEIEYHLTLDGQFTLNFSKLK